MIPYDELERALNRWKARRTGGGDGDSPDVVREEGAPQFSEDTNMDVGGEGDRDVSGQVPYQSPDSTGELDLTDAEVDET